MLVELVVEFRATERGAVLSRVIDMDAPPVAGMWLMGVGIEEGIDGARVEAVLWNHRERRFQVELVSVSAEKLWFPPGMGAELRQLVDWMYGPDWVIDAEEI